MDSVQYSAPVPEAQGNSQDLLQLQPTITSINDKGELQTMAGPTLVAPSNVSLSSLKKMALKELGLTIPSAGDPESHISGSSAQEDVSKDASRDNLEQPTGEEDEGHNESDVGGQPTVFIARSRCRPRRLVRKASEWREAVTAYLAGRQSRQKQLLGKAVANLQPLLFGDDAREQLRSLMGLREICCSVDNVKRGVVTDVMMQRFVSLCTLDHFPVPEPEPEAAPEPSSPRARKKWRAEQRRQAAAKAAEPAPEKHPLTAASAGCAAPPALDVVLQALGCLWTLAGGDGAGDDCTPAPARAVFSAMRRWQRKHGTVGPMVQTLVQYTPCLDKLHGAKHEDSGWGDTLSLLGGKLKKLKKQASGVKALPASSHSLPIPRVLQMEIVSALHIARVSSNNSRKCFTCAVVKWDGVELGKTATVASDCAPIWQDELFSIKMPLHDDDIDGHHVSVELYDMADEETEELGTLMGCVNISGRELKRLPSWAHGKSELTRRNYELLPQKNSDPDAPENRFVQGKLQICMSVLSKPIDMGVSKNLVVELLTASELGTLSKGTGGKTESAPCAFAIVYWNDQRVFATRVIPNSSNPVWREHYIIKSVPGDMTHCSLRIMLWDWEGSGRGRGQFLGQAEWSGTKDIQDAANDLRMRVVLQKKEDTLDGSTSDLFRNKMFNQNVRGSLICRLSLTEPPKEGAVHMPMYTTVGNISACVALRFSIVAASKLSAKKKGGRPGTFCTVHWQGKLIGHSAVVEDSQNPEWESSFLIVLPPECLLVPGSAQIKGNNADGDGADSSIASTPVKWIHPDMAQHQLEIEVSDREEGYVMVDGATLLKHCIDGGRRNLRLSRQAPSSGKQKPAKASLAIDFDRLGWIDKVCANSRADFVRRNAASQGLAVEGDPAQPWLPAPMPMQIARIHVADLVSNLSTDVANALPDVFCVVLWGGAVVGRTAVKRHDVNPSFDEDEFIVPRLRPGTKRDTDVATGDSGLCAGDGSGLVIDVRALEDSGIEGRLLGRLALNDSKVRALSSVYGKRVEYDLAEPERTIDSGTKLCSDIDGRKTNHASISLKFHADIRLNDDMKSKMQNRAASWALSAKRNIKSSHAGVMFDSLEKNITEMPPSAKRLQIMTHTLGILGALLTDAASTCAAASAMGNCAAAQLAADAAVGPIVANGGEGMTAMLSIMSRSTPKCDEDTQVQAELAANVLVSFVRCEIYSSDAGLATCISANMVAKLAKLTMATSRHVANAALCLLAQVYKHPGCRNVLAESSAREQTIAVLVRSVSVGLSYFERLKNLTHSTLRGEAGVGRHGHVKGQKAAVDDKHLERSSSDDVLFRSLQYVTAIIWGCVHCIAIGSSARDMNRVVDLELDVRRKLSLLLEDLMMHDQTRADDTILAASVATLRTLIEWCPSRQLGVQGRRASYHHNECDAFLDSAVESYLHFALLECIDADRRAATNIALLDTLQTMLCAQQQDKASDAVTHAAACHMSQLLIRAGAYEILLGLLMRSCPSDAAVQSEIMQVQTDAAVEGAKFCDGSAEFARVQEVGASRARSDHARLHVAAAKTLYRLAESATHAKDGGPGNDNDTTEGVHFEKAEKTRISGVSPTFGKHVTGADVEDSLVRALLLLLPNASDEIVQLLTLTLWWWAHSLYVREAIVKAGAIPALTAEIRRGRFRTLRSVSCALGALTLLLRHRRAAFSFVQPITYYVPASPHEVADALEGKQPIASESFTGAGGVTTMMLLVASFLPSTFSASHTSVMSDDAYASADDATEIVELALSILLQLLEMSEPELYRITCAEFCGLTGDDAADAELPPWLKTEGNESDQVKDEDEPYTSPHGVASSSIRKVKPKNPQPGGEALLLLLNAAMDHRVKPRVRLLAAAVMIKVGIDFASRQQIMHVADAAATPPPGLRAWCIATKAAAEVNDPEAAERLLAEWPNAQRILLRREEKLTQYTRFLRRCEDGEEAREALIAAADDDMRDALTTATVFDDRAALEALIDEWSHYSTLSLGERLWKLHIDAESAARDRMLLRHKREEDAAARAASEVSPQKKGASSRQINPAKEQVLEASTDTDDENNMATGNSLGKRRIQRQNLISMLRLLPPTPAELMHSGAFTIVDGHCVRKRESQGSIGVELWEQDMDSVYVARPTANVCENESTEDVNAVRDAEPGETLDVDASDDAHDGTDVGTADNSDAGTSPKSRIDQVEPAGDIRAQAAADIAGVEEILARGQDAPQTVYGTESVDDELDRATQQLQAVEIAIETARRERDRAELLHLMRKRIQLMAVVEKQKRLRSDVVVGALADADDMSDAAPSSSNAVKLKGLLSRAAFFVNDRFQGKMVLEAMLFELVCSDSVALVHYGLVALVWLTDAASGMMHGGSSPEELAVGTGNANDVDEEQDDEVNWRRRTVGSLGVPTRCLQLVRSAFAEHELAKYDELKDGTPAASQLDSTTRALVGSRTIDSKSISDLDVILQNVDEQTMLNEPELSTPKDSSSKQKMLPLPVDETGSVPLHIRSWAIRLLEQLSKEESNQILIARAGLLELVHASRRGIGIGVDRRRLASLLTRLRRHPQNRTRFYKTELRLKLYDVREEEKVWRAAESERVPPSAHPSIAACESSKDAYTFWPADCPMETYLGVEHKVAQPAKPTLQSAMQGSASRTWEPEFDEPFAAQDIDMADLSAVSPFLTPSVQLTLAQIMQRNVATQKPAAPTAMSPPKCWRPTLPLPPKPAGHTLPAAREGHFGDFPDIPMNLEFVVKHCN